MTKTDLSQPKHLTVAVEDYLKAIYQLREEGPDGPARVTTTALAERLDVAPGSVTGMIKKLADEGLVVYAPYHGVELTGDGKLAALGVIRRHRLIEMFLVHVLGYGWDVVHAEAERLEHVVSEEFLDRVDALLCSPDADPHGDPIPSKDGVLPVADARPLSRVQPDEGAFTIQRVRTQDPDYLRFLREQRLVPGERVAVIRREQIGGLLHLRHLDGGDQPDQTIAPEVARLIWVAVSSATQTSYVESSLQNYGEW